jgi:hypothetical protein
MNCPYKKITTEIKKEDFTSSLQTTIITEKFSKCDDENCMAYVEQKCKLME